MLRREFTSMSQYFDNVTDALRRIKSELKLSSDDVRASINDVLQMVREFPGLRR